MRKHVLHGLEGVVRLPHVGHYTEANAGFWADGGRRLELESLVTLAHRLLALADVGSAGHEVAVRRGRG